MDEKEAQKDKEKTQKTVKYYFKERILRLINKRKNTNCGKNKGNNEQKASLTDRLQTWCMVFIVIITALYAGFAWKQADQMERAVEESQIMRDSSDKSTSQILKQMKKQSNAMIETAEANRISAETTRLRDRAFVYFLDPIIFPYPSSEKTVTWGLSIQLQNAGSMPARGVSVRCAHVEFPITKDIHDPWTLAKGNWSNIQVPDVVGSKSIHQLPVPDISVDTMNRAKKLQSVIFIFMEATYLDGFVKKRRITQMSRVLGYDVEGGKSARYTRTHNCSDDDCDKK